MSPINSLPRRTFLQSALAVPLAGAAFGFSPAEGSYRSTVRVTAGQDRFGHRRRVFGSLPIDVKVSGSDTGGGLLLIEQINDGKGGPPRHLHHSQEEWFYVIDGDYLIEVGEERFELGSGDSVLAPRGIPHAWAHAGEGTGRMLIGFQPAGRMGDFFAAATQLEAIPAGPDLARLFREHDMELVGPPLIQPTDPAG
jgi:quercetin 2,3-dioxygenase